MPDGDPALGYRTQWPFLPDSVWSFACYHRDVALATLRFSKPSRQRAILLAGWIALLAAAASGCRSTPTDDTPAGAVRLFLDAIWAGEVHDSDDDRESLTLAYELLDSASRDRLARAARLAGALGGREREPWEMLAAGASRMVIMPRRSGGLRERIEPNGREATVTVSDESGGSADVRLVREEDGWRVLLDIPEREGD